MENFCYLNKYVYPCNAQNKNFYNSIMCCFRVICQRNGKKSFLPQLRDVTMGLSYY